MDKTILTDITIFNLNTTSVKKLTHKLKKVLEEKTNKPFKNAEVNEILASLLEYQSWNHFAAALKLEKSEKDITKIKLKFVDDFLEHADDSENHLDYDDRGSVADYPYSYMLYGEGCECNFETEVEAKLDMFDTICTEYAYSLRILKSSAYDYILSGDLDAKSCALQELPLAVWQKEDNKLLALFESLSDRKLNAIALHAVSHGYNVADSNDSLLVDAVVYAVFENASVVGLTFTDGTEESKAFNWLSQHIVKYIC